MRLSLNFFSKPIFSILILAFVLRLAILFFLGPSESIGGDFPLFDRMARNLMSLGDFGGEPAATYGSPNINPGFALWLSVLYFIFGVPFGAEVPSILFWLAQIFLGVLIVWGGYLLGLKVVGEKVAIMSALILTVFPSLILVTVEDSSVLLYSTLFLYGVYFFYRWFEDRKIIFAVFSGILLGISALTDSIAFYIPLILIFYTLFQVFRLRLPLKTIVIPLLILTFSFISVFTPWSVRNLKVARTSNSEFKVISKGETQVLSSKSVTQITKGLAEGDILTENFKRMFLSPYGTWLLDRGLEAETLIYKDLFKEFLRGARFSPETNIILSLKIVVVVFYLIIAVIAISTSFYFRRFGILLLLLIIYSFAADTAFVALQGGNFNLVSHSSIFIFPLLPIFAILAGTGIVQIIRKFKEAKFSLISV